MAECCGTGCKRCLTGIEKKSNRNVTCIKSGLVGLQAPVAPGVRRTSCFVAREFGPKGKLGTMRPSKAGQVATFMKKLGWLIGIVALSLVGLESRGAVLGKRNELERVNACIQGQVLDFTHNH